MEDSLIKVLSDGIESILSFDIFLNFITVFAIEHHFLN